MAESIHVPYRSKPWTRSEKPDAQRQRKDKLAGEHKRIGEGSEKQVDKALSGCTSILAFAESWHISQDAEIKNAHAGVAE
jgi:hypothetical protein